MNQRYFIDRSASVVPKGEQKLPVTFENWVRERSIRVLGTNSGSEALAFQNWRRFKEAFAPELIKQAVTSTPRKVQRCLDPFGGSGTTALACQFLGVKPVTIEVNPYLADLTEAKLSTYDVGSLTRDFGFILRQADKVTVDPRGMYANAPATLIEPGKSDRWVFDFEVAERLAAYRSVIDVLPDHKNARLFRVLLGGILTEVSNVVISGKGRRYRSGWQTRRHTADQLDELFLRSVENAIGDIVRHAERKELGYDIYRGDSRELIKDVGKIDLAVFSPPYPNSFDYTDVYNIELWALGYLDSKIENTKLRLSTLSSHVQVRREFKKRPSGSITLDKALRSLGLVRDELWDKNLVEMIGGYFADMIAVLKQISSQLSENAEIWMVVGDSKYAGISIPVAQILCELAEQIGCTALREEPFRSMRASPQQGGANELEETLVVLGRT